MKRLVLAAALFLLGIGTAVAQTSAAAVLATPSYELGAGDHLHITVFGETDLTGDYIVSAGGSVSYPLLGELPAAGKTPEQFSQLIAEGLRQGYLRNPQVSTAVTSYRPFYILGEVTNPGTYPYAADLDAMSAVATAGGFTYRANTHRIFIKHLGETRERPYDLNAAVPIRPGDTIRVGERFF